MRRWFGWRCRTSVDPIGHRDARKIRMSVLMTIAVIAVVISACFRFELFGPYRESALSVISMATVTAFPATVILAAILWSMFSTDYRKLRVITGVFAILIALPTYFIVTADIFPRVTPIWFWQILIAATFLLPFFGMLIAIRGFGYRITPYNLDDFLSAETEQPSSPFDD